MQKSVASDEKMNEYMIAQWNRKVRCNNEVVVLGDFPIAKGENTNDIVQQRLNGRKYLIIGNHDKFLNDKTFVLL